MCDCCWYGTHGRLFYITKSALKMHCIRDILSHKSGTLVSFHEASTELVNTASHYIHSIYYNMSLAETCKLESSSEKFHPQLLYC